MVTRSVFNRLLAGVAGATVVALAGCAGGGMRTPEVKVMLRGANEVPSANSSASGSATFWVNADKTVSGMVQTTGLTGNAAHIHVGKSGTNGPVAVGLTQTSNGNWSVPAGARFTDDQYRAYQAGDTYVNVHSAQFPGGEIRGQLRP